MFLNKKYSYIAAAMILISILMAAVTGCSALDNYFISRADYDDLENKYNKTLQQMQKQDEIIKLYTEEKAKLVEHSEEKNEQINSLNEEIELLDKEILMLEEKLDSKSIENLEKQIEELSSDPVKLRRLLNNINDLLKYVYTGSSAQEGLGYSFTAFSIEYKGNNYIITAGHCINDNYGSEGAFKFKSNFSDRWIYPELLAYKAEFWKLNDYAVFFNGNIGGGLKTGEIETEENYLLGSIDKRLSVFRNLGDSSKRGESGSPVINEEMQVIGIYVIYGYVYTPIKLALEAIDNAVIN